MNVQISEFVFSILGIEGKCDLSFLMYLLSAKGDQYGFEFFEMLMIFGIFRKFNKFSVLIFEIFKSDLEKKFELENFSN